MAPSALPEGIPVPNDGLLPEQVCHGASERAFTLYIHVPYCRVRCGYCDFNTYTMQGFGEVKPSTYAEDAIAELRFARAAMERSGLPERAVSSIFFGGGTPTVLAASDLARILAEVRRLWPLSQRCEITTEANPDSVDERYLAALARSGFTRVSFGMQSAVPHVLATLERTHTPERVPQAVAWAKAAGLHTSLDLIYGTPGESVQDWERSLEAALACTPHHLSAYSLTIETGTVLARQLQRGEIEAVDPDTQAEMYEIAECSLSHAGFAWYEISNWAREHTYRCEHNLSYWRGQDWWGIGPGAHSHIGGVRWWNVKHPRAYATRVQAGHSPGYAREILDASTRRIERILLEIRLASGLAVSLLTPTERETIPALIEEGLVSLSVQSGEISLTEADASSSLLTSPALNGLGARKNLNAPNDPGALGEINADTFLAESERGARLVLTLRGRLLADTVIHRLLAGS